jgi:4,5-dihydroxyphthalate decarboxylase
MDQRDPRIGNQGGLIATIHQTNFMSNINLTIATDVYDHVRDLTDGTVRAEGIDLTVLKLQLEEIFYRFTKFREWDISELSMGKYIALRSQDDTSITAIPVFISRVFRHSSIYVKAGSALKSPEQLKGKRIGIPEWAQTASIYSRGLLAHEYGVPLASVEWVQAGVNQPGRIEKVELKLPAGVRYRNEPEKSLDAMVQAGELDAMLSARPPQSLGRGIDRMIPDYRPVEEAYFRKTGVYPIMHVIALRTPVLEQYPWAAMNLLKAFEESKRRSMVRLAEIAATHAPVPWLGDTIAQLRALLGPDIFPYGIEPNRKTLETFVQYGYEQGVCHRKLSVEELFPASVQSSFKV